MLKNKKGMTLIEIIVTLAVVVIALALTGSILLSSLGLYSGAAAGDLDKQGLDQISEYFHDTLVYATDVYVQGEKPDDSNDWNEIHVSGNRLYTNDKLTFDEAYYDGRLLNITVRGYDSYRLDFKFTYTSKSGSSVYSTKSTLELVNLKERFGNDNTFNPFDNISDIQQLDDSGLKVWYKASTKETSSSIGATTGTVADVISQLNANNNRGFWYHNYNDYGYYFAGDFVYYEDYWWQNISYASVTLGSQNMYSSGRSTYFRKIDANYDSTSAYLKGDIIAYNGKYYIADKDMIGWTPAPDWAYSKGTYWDEVNDKTRAAKTYDIIQASDAHPTTVLSKMSAADKAGAKTYDSSATYKVGDFVKISNSYSPDGYDFYLKIFAGSGKPGTSASSGWEIMANDYEPYSAYLKGDVVIYTQGNYRIVRALKNINYATYSSTTTPAYLIDNNKKVWGALSY